MCNDLSNNYYSQLIQSLKIDCAKCCGLCCIALYCSKTDGFPADKVAGVPCKNLLSDYKCLIHNDLYKKNMKGCLSYECFGAGQKVTQHIYKNSSWKNSNINKQKMFDVFTTIFQLHQMLWYLLEAINLCEDNQKSEIDNLIIENENITTKSTDEILNFDIEKYRQKVNLILKSIVDQYDKFKSGTLNYIGKNFKNKDFDGKNFSMSLLIGSNFNGCSFNKASFLGADMRDANLKNADLSGSIFLTQMQINSAKGNSNTKLPSHISRPKTW